MKLLLSICLIVVGVFNSYFGTSSFLVNGEVIALSRTRPIVRYYFAEQAKRKHEKEIATNRIISSEEYDSEGTSDAGELKSSNNGNDDESPFGDFYEDSAENVTTTTSTVPPKAAPIPIVLWHGMGDNAVGIKFALNFIAKEIPGVYIKSLQIGSNPAKDTENGFFMNVNDQVATVCADLSQDKELANGYNAIGISQGGQFFRAVAQRCPNPPIRNLISIGGQHQGVFGLPQCSAPKQSWCEIVDKLITHAAYSEWVQKFLVQAEYWHDPFKAQEYIDNSVFLADINNEKVQNATYKENLQKLKNFVLIKFDGDTIVEPKESEWFGYFVDGQDKLMYKLEDSLLYKEDRLGLRTLNEAGKLHFLAVPGNHLIFTKEWFIKNVVQPFLM